MKNASVLKILVVAGASGGHIFPALGFLDTLREKCDNVEALLILPKKTKISQLETSGYKVSRVAASPIKLNADIKNIFNFFEFFIGSFESLFILLSFKPDIVVGFGSLVCLPSILFAWVFRIKTLIHEQNVTPGRANRFLARFADKIAISFRETEGYLEGYKKKIALTGNPIRRKIIETEKNQALDFFGLDYNKFTILVMGGSLGSHSINVGVLNAIRSMSDTTGMQIVHLAGSADYGLLEYKYKDLNTNIKLYSFLNQMRYAYGACDIVICRGGATTIAEIIFFGLPAIIIPYPFAYKHQLENARILERLGSAIIFDDGELLTDKLAKTLEDFINKPDKIKSMRQSYDTFQRVNANDELVDCALSLERI